MFNTNVPTFNDLPTSAQLLRSTVLAMITAAVLLVTVVMPSEYAVDPTGVGRALGLTQMGEVKLQLAEEARADEAAAQSAAMTAAVIPSPTTAPAPIVVSVQPAPAKAVPTPAPQTAAAPQSSGQQHEMSITSNPTRALK
jgi:hypothetical protein